MIRRDGGAPQRPQAWSQAPEPPIMRRSELDKPQRPADGPEPTRRYEAGPAVEPRPARPPAYSQPPRRPTPPAPPAGRAPRRRRRLPFGKIFLLLLVLVLVLPVVAVFYLDSQLNRIDALVAYPGRIADTPGTNWLLVGSDSRTGLTPEQERELATGGEVGTERTDTIMLIHVPKSGPSTMVSIPRDSYVTIPGSGRDKINASFAIGGPQLLVRTVEEATGVRIDHYAQIGFSGFAGIVDALGGIDVCLDRPIDDPLAGINLPAGCQKLNGAQSLGFVRTRATDLADIDRINNQRKFLSALLAKASSPGTFLNPFRLWPLARDSAASLKVDDGDHIWNLAALAWALRGEMVTTTVPFAGFEDTDAGNVLLWDRDRAIRFFQALARDQQIPPDLITSGR